MPSTCLLLLLCVLVRGTSMCGCWLFLGCGFAQQCVGRVGRVRVCMGVWVALRWLPSQVVGLHCNVFAAWGLAAGFALALGGWFLTCLCAFARACVYLHACAFACVSACLSICLSESVFVRHGVHQLVGGPRDPSRGSNWCAERAASDLCRH